MYTRRAFVYYVHMEDAEHHYHVWVLEIQATDGGQLRFDDVPYPTSYVHRTAANRVRSRLISDGTRPELVRVLACHSSPCQLTLVQPKLFDSSGGRSFDFNDVIYKSKRGEKNSPPRD